MLKEKGIGAAKRFLKKEGYEIVETSPDYHNGFIDIIAKEKDVVVFVKVSVHEDNMPNTKNDSANREDFEKVAIEFLAGYEKTDIQVRFDRIAIVIVAPERALLRHHINAVE